MKLKKNSVLSNDVILLSRIRKCGQDHFVVEDGFADILIQTKEWVCHDLFDFKIIIGEGTKTIWKWKKTCLSYFSICVSSHIKE